MLAWWQRYCRGRLPQLNNTSGNTIQVNPCSKVQWLFGCKLFFQKPTNTSMCLQQTCITVFTCTDSSPQVISRTSFLIFRFTPCVLHPSKSCAFHSNRPLSALLLFKVRLPLSPLLRHTVVLQAEWAAGFNQLLQLMRSHWVILSHRLQRSIKIQTQQIESIHCSSAQPSDIHTKRIKSKEKRFFYKK